VRIKNEQEEIAAEGKAVIVCFDYDTNQTVAVSEIRKKKMREYDL
jgi:acyl-CoA thioesterase FadM